MNLRTCPVTRVAVVGTGSVGARHLEVLRGMERVHPIAIPRRPERIGQLEAAGYSTARGLDDAIREGATHCIVASDTSRHVEDGLTALKGGLDVLVEKPLATDAGEARVLSERAKAARRQLFVGCALRFSESLNTFRELYHRVGCLHAVRIESQSYLPEWRPTRQYVESYSARANEGGILRDMIHEIDYAGWLFGWPASVQGRVRNLGRLHIGADEIAEVTWETSTGCLVSVLLDYLSRPARRRMRACGERGTIEWDGIKSTVTLSVDGAEVQEARSSQNRNEMFLAQARAFVTAEGESRDPRLATGEEGVKALAVCDATRRASEGRCEERVEWL